ncbi:helix-turn-helix domain-containing protein [Mycolicibacterium baixiangningiae]|uniref:helix-turn-helix domain-containing protein n=1 Tax=Mycolicibacterium baixiangningiae TaxID=2761578 RepID=UPI0018D0C83C|nr:PucR family transcriptional regulator ligand-binding domain-containing protein [Mycolicibacterium baixiangningiae]
MLPSQTSLSLRDILDDPAMAAARPQVLAGWGRLDTEIRWVHTSEVLDIAELLSGGELLLVAGVILSDSGPDQLRAYIDSLADAGAAGLAVERPRTGAFPAALTAQAAVRDFPLIELTEVVRFVEVTRAINSRLVNESVRALHFNDEVTHMLAGVLAAQGDLDDMVSGLSALSGCSIAVRSVSGAVLASTDVEGARPRSYGHVAAIESAGVTIATLEVLPRPGVDLQMVTAVCRRAPESLALALLRWRPLTRSDQHLREVFRLLALAEDTTRPAVLRADTESALRRAARDLGFAPGGWYVGVVAISVDEPIQVAELSAVLRRDDRPVLSEIRDGRHRSIVRFDGRQDADTVLDTLVSQLYSSPLPRALRIGVGEPRRDLPELAEAMSTAATAALLSSETEFVGLARDVAIDHFLSEVDSAAVDRFLHSVLGPLLTAERSTELIATLAALFRTGSRVAAAKALNIHRQTMYQRISRIETIMGRPLGDGSGSTGALLVAVELAAVRDRLGRRR